MEALGEMMDRDAQASVVHGMREVVTGGRTAGGKRRAGSASTAARSKSSGQGFAALTGRAACTELAGGSCGGLAREVVHEMLINVATRKFARSVRLPEGDVPGPARAGLSKSAASRRFVALSAARMKDWMASDLSGLDLLVIQIDGISARPLFLGPRSPRGDRCLATSPRSRPARRKCWPCPKRLTPAATAASRVPSISRIGTGLLIEPTRPQPMPSTETHTPLPKDRCSIVPAT